LPSSREWRKTLSVLQVKPSPSTPLRDLSGWQADEDDDEGEAAPAPAAAAASGDATPRDPALGLVVTVPREDLTEEARLLEPLAYLLQPLIESCREKKPNKKQSQLTL
jgi:hypothetical protein